MNWIAFSFSSAVTAVSRLQPSWTKGYLRIPRIASRVAQRGSTLAKVISICGGRKLLKTAPAAMRPLRTTPIAVESPKSSTPTRRPTQRATSASHPRTSISEPGAPAQIDVGPEPCDGDRGAHLQLPGKGLARAARDMPMRIDPRLGRPGRRVPRRRVPGRARRRRRRHQGHVDIAVIEADAEGVGDGALRLDDGSDDGGRLAVARAEEVPGLLARGVDRLRAVVEIAGISLVDDAAGAAAEIEIVVEEAEGRGRHALEAAPSVVRHIVDVLVEGAVGVRHVEDDASALRVVERLPAIGVAVGGDRFGSP